MRVSLGDDKAAFTADRLEISATEQVMTLAMLESVAMGFGSIAVNRTPHGSTTPRRVQEFR